jgi:UDP-glucose 4-epimerase
LIKAFKTNKPPVISNPAAANDYIYVDDVINAFVKAVEDKNCDGVFNLGSGQATSVAEISGLVERVIRNSDDFSSQLIKKVASIKSGSGMWADITSSGRQLGWAPQVLLIDGINRTIDGVCGDGDS